MIGSDLHVWGQMYRRCREGLAPAEMLPQTLRHRLLRELRDAEWTIDEIATHTMTTPYTVIRILNAKEPT